MSILRAIQGKSPSAIETLREGWYTGPFTKEWREKHRREFNTAPPDVTMYCHKCGSPARWVRLFPDFNVKDGRAGHKYLFRCSLPPDYTKPLQQDAHYDSHKYLWLARDDETLDTADIQDRDYA